MRSLSVPQRSGAQARIRRDHDVVLSAPASGNRDTSSEAVVGGQVGRGTDENPIVVAQDVTLGYRGRVLFGNLSFDIDRGAILGIVGPNGCGKTTLLRTILGLLPPLDGRVRRDPNLIVSYVPQRERLDTILPLTALDIVLLGRSARAGALRRHSRADHDAALRALAQVDAEALGPQRYRSLSGGQQQRVLLARALVAEPDLLVLDEPTAGMDIASEAGTVEFLRDLNRRAGVTILLVTHLLPLVLNLASSIMLLASDRILYGTVDEVLREDRLRALYGVPVRLGAVAGQRTLVVSG
jgi:ABC-type Mn2+/Zn2+ transport system ATPase subunit